MRRTLHRRREINDVASLARFETFLASAVATVLLVRLFLAATGYPQVGGNGLHVAHVLWGGLAMGIALSASAIGLGSRIGSRVAVLGGIGFGLFIDEVGKFVTKSVNYFFKPAVAIIYAVFVLFYLVVRAVLKRRELTDGRRIALAAGAVADQALGQLDEAHRQRALGLLDQVRVEKQAAATVRAALLAQPVTPTRVESRLTRMRNRALASATGLLERRRFQQSVITIFIAGAVLIVIGAIADIATDNLSKFYPKVSEVCALVSGFAAAVITVVGAVQLLRGARIRALETLQVGVLINLLVTDVFQFATIQFAALASLFVQLIVLAGIRFALQVEELSAAAEHAQPVVVAAPRVMG
jgi:hypothetical protein